MKGKILATLFVLPFLGFGLWMLWSIGSTLYTAAAARDWAPVQATVVRGGYTTSSGDDADTYRAYADYTYSYRGRAYTGDRVSLSAGGDNIGDYQQEIGRRLARAASEGQPVTVYVDPAEPARSVVDRDVRWGLLAFQSIFVIVFGAGGLAALYFVWRAPRKKDKSLAVYQDQPWLLNDAWQSATIRSNSRHSMLAAWAFAGLWCLVSGFLPFLIYDEIVEKQNYLAAIGLLFPLVGLGLLVWALLRTREWTRFGPTPVTLDPYPGAIGGHVGGTIDLKLPFETGHRFKLTLTNIHSYMSGSGDDRSRRESASWQDTTLAHAEPGTSGTRLLFRFDVPDGLHPADPEPDDSYHLWRLNLQAELPGADLDRDYEIPVFATGAESRLLPESAVQRARESQAAADAATIRKYFDLGYAAGGPVMHYPVGRHIGSSLGGFVAGCLFAAAGWWLIAREGQALFGSVFGGVGALIALVTLYMMLNSLNVRQEGSELVSVRRLLGIPIRTRRIPRHAVRGLETDSSFQAQSGGKHTMYFKVLAVSGDGSKVVVGEGFRGRNEADAAMRLIAREFGLPLPPEPAAGSDGDGYLGPEVLT